MEEDNLKTKTISSMLWTATQRFGVLILSFVSNLVLAHFLTADDYGVVGMISIFISLAETITDSGLGQALIQKKDTTDIDYSTVFWSNLILSVALYVVLFFSAPLIARFYNMEILTKILRIKAIIIILQGLRLIQTTILQKQLNFKKISIIYLTASLFSTIVSIVLAILGWGLWSLVVKTLLDISLRTILFWIFGKWKPKFSFSISSFKQLFSFGFVMLITSLIVTLYGEGQGLIIGKAFSAATLGYYTQAVKLQDAPSSALSQIVNQVTYPVFSKLNDDIEKMKKGLKKIIVSISYIAFPMMVFFIVCAPSLFNFLFTSKWNQSIPYFRYLCVVGMIGSINMLNTNIIRATGKKGLYFRLQVIKRIIGIIIIILSVYFGMTGLLIARIIIEYLFFVINAYATKKAINYKITEQILDILPNFLLAFITGLITFFIQTLFHFPSLNSRFESLLIILIMFFIFTPLFIFLSKLLHFKGYSIYKDIILQKLHRDKKDE